jgi:hypothetical protein
MYRHASTARISPNPPAIDSFTTGICDLAHDDEISMKIVGEEEKKKKKKQKNIEPANKKTKYDKEELYRSMYYCHSMLKGYEKTDVFYHAQKSYVAERNRCIQICTNIDSQNFTVVFDKFLDYLVLSAGGKKEDREEDKIRLFDVILDFVQSICPDEDERIRVALLSPFLTCLISAYEKKRAKKSRRRNSLSSFNRWPILFKKHAIFFVVLFDMFKCTKKPDTMVETDIADLLGSLGFTCK